MNLLKKSKHIPTIFTISYSLLSAYTLATLSNKRECTRNADKIFFNVSTLNGGLAGLITSRLNQISFGYNFLHVTLGMLASSVFYASITQRNKIENTENSDSK